MTLRLLPWVAVAAVLGLQGCGREPPVTTVRPPAQSLPEDTVLRGAAAPAQPAAPAPTETTRMGAAPLGTAPAAPPAGTAAPTEMAPATPAVQVPPATSSTPPAAPLPTVKNPGDAQGAQLLAQRTLAVPVLGVQPAGLSDQYEQGRAGHVHEAVDILAPLGTPVVAVDDGRIEKLFDSKPGGHTIYQYDAAGQLAYYYAHLQRYAEGLREGQPVRRGQLIGYVGVSGNADPGTPHLHFAVFRLGTPAKWWEGEAVNPYPALSRATPVTQLASR